MLLPHVVVIIGLYVFLSASSLFLLVWKKAKPDKDMTELALRIKSWWLMLTLFALVLLVNKQVTIFALALLSFLALKEYLSLIPTRRADRRVLLWVYLAIPIQFYWIYRGFYGMFIIFIPVYMFLFIPLRMILKGEAQGFLKAAGTLQWGLMMIVFNLSHMAYLFVLPTDTTHVPFLSVTVRHDLASGAGLLLYLVMMTQLNDVFQYICGKMFGRRPIVPKVSPKKTWEGLAGAALLSTLLAAAVGPVLTPMGITGSLVSGALIGIAGFIGDVTISALKRDLGIKDSGAMIPGHGGILDRVDSLTFTAPLFFHFIRFFYY